MTTEEKALALLGEVSPYKCEKVDHAHHAYLCAALRLSVEQHEAAEQELADYKQELADYKQKVSDAAEKQARDVHEVRCLCSRTHKLRFNKLSQFIIPAPKRDPLEEVLQEIDHAAMWVDERAKEIRAALEARGLEIKEKSK
jgi:hypothetical protein